MWRGPAAAARPAKSIVVKAADADAAVTDEAPVSTAARARTPPIPMTLLTGFLGAGKTTLLNRLVKDPAFAGTAVIINEFGEVGIDHLLVERAEDGIVELSSGCICCTIRGELVEALERLLRGLDNGRVAEMRRVVIETTGLADPAPILYLLTRHPYLSLRFRLDGIVTVVDAVNAMASLDAHEEAVRQVAVADRIVLTKTDLAGAAADGVHGAHRAAQPRRRRSSTRQRAKRPPALIGCGASRPRRRVRTSVAGSRRKRSRTITIRACGRPRPPSPRRHDHHHDTTTRT